MELQELGWLCLVSLFLVSLLIVLGWLCQYCMTLLHLQGSRSRTKQVGGDSPWPQLSVTVPKQSLAGTVGSFLQKLCLWRGRRPPSEAGVKGLLSSLFSYKSIREQCQRTWVKALNEQACRHGVSYLTQLSTCSVRACSYFCTQMHEGLCMCCVHELWLCVGRGDGGVGGGVSNR